MTGLGLYQSRSHDPYYNLAVEQYLLENLADDKVILYLWQNQNTVVIGKNQNPWKECRTTLLEQEGGHLARRLSGGGAVFHDLGNLNFTFLMPQSRYDLTKQLTVIVEALRPFGISAEISGRNDLTASGRKFSGNAFYKNGKQAYHHGTLLVDVDRDKLSRYLSPSKAKLQAKGVDSVRSRVVNLKELCPDITVPALEEALAEAFRQVYGLPLETIGEDALDIAAIDALAVRNRSWEWNYGQKMPFTLSCEGRFPWGGIQIDLQVEAGQVRQAKVYSDAMDCFLPPRLEQALTGCRFTKDALTAAVRSAGEDTAPDICSLLSRQEL